MKNLIKSSFNQASRDIVTDAITVIENEATGKLAAVNEEQRVRYGSINEQNKLLVNKTYDMRQDSPALSSPDVDWAEFEADYEARQFLESCAERLERIASQMRGTKILHDYDNYQDALDDYAYAQYKRGADAPGFAEKVAEMRQFFNRTGAKKEKTAANPDSNNEEIPDNNA